MSLTPESNISSSLLEAYVKTDYSFTDGSKTIVIRMDDENPDLLSYLKLKNITSWAYITAWNPFSFPQTDEYNQSQQKLLLTKLNKYQVFEGEGKSREGNWPGEESYFVAGISREEAYELGYDFGQNAILVSGENLKPELLLISFSTD